MIQRIQSFYLSLTILIAFIFLKGSILNFFNNSGTVIKISFRGIVRITTGNNYELIDRLWPLSVIIIAIPVVSMITIFLYKNRKVQLWFSILGIIISAIFILLSSWYGYFTCHKYDTSILPGFNMFLPLFILIFNILAFRGILKDDRLVKSYDRLR